MRFSLLICCLAVLGVPKETAGNDKAVPAPRPANPSISVRIETGRLNLAARVDTVNLVLESDSALGGFDFKLMAENRQVAIVEIIPGRLIDSCRWEFFTARELTVAFDDQVSDQPAWQITALPEMIPDSVKPACYGSEEPISLCRLVVSNAHSNPMSAEPGQNQHETRILFVWEDCGDNSISSFSGNHLWLSASVTGSDSSPLGAIFPNTSGASISCISNRNSDRVIRLIDFQAGTILFQDDKIERLKTDSSDS